MNECTILVSSCDKYIDAWEPFFRLLKLQWPNCPYDIVLSTETKTYECDFLNVRTLYSLKSLSWSSRLKNVLNQIETEYVLFFLEDFFLLEKVKIEIFEQALQFLKNHENAYLFEFPSVDPGYEEATEIKEERTFKRVPKYEPYRAKVMVSLWRKKDFQRLLFENENPWQCEKETSIRSIAYGKDIYRQDYKYSLPAFYYHINPQIGFGITGGKWLKNNKPFFESKGINGVNYENLGINEAPDSYTKLKDNEKAKKTIYIKKVLSSRDVFLIFKEGIHIVKKWIIKKLRIDLLYKIIRYRKYYKKRNN